MVNSVGFVISKGDLASGPRTRLYHSRDFVYQRFIKLKKDRETSEIDIRRETESAPLPASFSKGAIYFLNSLLQ